MISLPVNTIGFAAVRDDLIIPALESFHKHNDPNLHRVIVIDQTLKGLPDLVQDGLAHIHLRAYRNLGFAKAMNTIVRLTDTQYVTVSNDDVLWFDDRYWEGIIKIFARVKNAAGVNPSCPKMPGWGFGQKEPIYIAEVDSREKCDGAWDKLKEQTPLRGLVNGVAMWCTTFDIERLQVAKLLGNYRQLFDERFYPGGGEDYDLLGRCAKANVKIYGTHESWIWHDWGKSKDEKGHSGMLKVAERPSWNKTGELWPDGFELGRKGERVPEIYVEAL